MVFIIATAILLLLLLTGIPIALSLALVGVLGFAVERGIEPAMIMLGQVGLDAATNYSFSVLPLFILMGNVIGRSQLAQDMYAAANAFLGHRRGGLAMATIGASGGFAAISGSSYACAATMTGVAVPAMRKYHYDPGFAGASVAVGGTLGVLIPPSIGMVFYSLITGVSLSKLMIAGILPGILTIVLYIAAIAIVTRRRSAYGPAGDRSSRVEKIQSLAGIWPMFLLFTLMLGGIYAGVFTAMEAAGIGAFVAMVMATLRRELSAPILLDIFTDTIKTTVNLFLVFYGALLFANFVIISGVPHTVADLITLNTFSPLAVLGIALIIYVVLGCILESTSLLLLTLPIFFPVLTGLGYDPIWLGIFVIVAAEIGLITPPIGMNVFVVSSMLPEVPAQKIFAALVPFLAADVVRVSLLIAIPSIVLILPGMMSS